MADIFDGQPRIFLSNNGAYFKFKGGQPVMDAGLENAPIISLYTREGWSGNYLFPNKLNQVGSGFEKANEKSITKNSLRERVEEAENATKWMVSENIASKINIDISNPNSNRVNMSVSIYPPGKDKSQILLTKNGVNWQEQAKNPAYLK